MYSTVGNTSDMDGDNTDASRGTQDTKVPHEQDKPASGKLQGVVIFVRKTEAFFEEYLSKEESMGDIDELQVAIKNLAIVLKSGDEDQSKYLLELMEKSDEKMMQLLSKLVFQLFKSKMFMWELCVIKHSISIVYVIFRNKLYDGVNNCNVISNHDRQFTNFWKIIHRDTNGTVNIKQYSVLNFYPFMGGINHFRSILQNIYFTVIEDTIKIRCNYPGDSKIWSQTHRLPFCLLNLISFLVCQKKLYVSQHVCVYNPTFSV